MRGDRRIFKGRLLDLFTRRVLLPNGHATELEIVRHPGAALIIPFLARNKIILLRQLRPVINSYIYELPAGTLDKGESLRGCARREIIEETGYAAKRLTRMGRIFPVPGYSTEEITGFKAEGLKKRKSPAQNDEVIRAFTVTKKEVRRLFEKNRIVDAKTICALAFCGWL